MPLNRVSGSSRVAWAVLVSLLMSLVSLPKLC